MGPTKIVAAFASWYEMMLQVKLFARARQLAGQEIVSVPWSAGMTVAGLKERLSQMYPGLRPMVPQLLVAVKQEYASNETVIQSTDEVACFPPVSGG